MTQTLEETYRLKLVDFQYTQEEMQRILAAALNDGNCVDDGGRYDWRAGSSITVWALPNTDANQQENTIKAIFYTHPAAHDPMHAAFIDAIEDVLEHLDINDHKFCAVHYHTSYTYDDALTELGTLECRAFGRVIYGQ